MSSTSTKLITALLSTGVGLCLCYAYLATRGPGANVKLVETRSGVSGIFEERARGAGSVPGEASPTEASREPVMVGRFNYAEMSEETARLMFPSIQAPNPQKAYDPHSFYWHVPGYRRMSAPRGTYKQDVLITNNNLGFRRVEDVSDSQPDLRVLVTGDSHTEGVVPMAAHYTELVEATLRGEFQDKHIEVLNGGVGGYSFFHYLGVIEKFRHLAPDVVVVSIYGGNDFAEIRRPYRFFHRLPLGPNYEASFARKVKALRTRRPQLYAQFFHQALAIHHQPEELELIERAVFELVREMDLLCRDMGARFVLQYIPPLYDVQPQFQIRQIEPALESFGLAYEDLKHTDRLADRVKALAAKEGIPFVDLRGPYRAAEDFLYWGSDHHINIRGNEVAAEALGPVIRELAF